MFLHTFQEVVLHDFRRHRNEINWSIIIKAPLVHYLKNESNVAWQLHQPAPSGSTWGMHLIRSHRPLCIYIPQVVSDWSFFYHGRCPYTPVFILVFRDSRQAFWTTDSSVSVSFSFKCICIGVSDILGVIGHDLWSPSFSPEWYEVIFRPVHICHHCVHFSITIKYLKWC